MISSDWTAASGVVVDSSAILAYLLRGPAARALGRRLFERDVSLFAPAIIDLEVMQTLRRYVLFREMNVADAEDAINSYGTIRILRFAHDPLIGRIWQLRANLTAYDAAYIALAEGTKAPLISLDARLARAAPPTVRVELFA